MHTASTTPNIPLRPSFMLKPAPHQEAKRVFNIEANAIQRLADLVDRTFDEAVWTILRADGRAVVTGVGKSGLIGRKIAATLASTGTPSLFLHPTEAFHGDLGMIGRGDVVIAISNSGETEELLRLLPFLRDNDNPVIAMTGKPNSRLANGSQYHLNVGVVEEACPLQLAPTASTTAALAMGDALAIALMKARGFEPEHFARFHPGGSLGRRLLMKVADEMVKDDLPFVDKDASALDVIKIISNAALGLALIRHNRGFGLITDGDLRRAIERNGESFFHLTAEQMMSPTPHTVPPSMSTHEAIELMHRVGITSLLVQENDNVVGIFKK